MNNNLARLEKWYVNRVPIKVNIYAIIELHILLQASWKLNGKQVHQATT